MIKSISMLLALLLLLSPYNYTNIAETPSISSPEETTPENQMDLTIYMEFLAGYCYEPCLIDSDTRFCDDILELLIRFSWYNKFDFVFYDEKHPYSIFSQGEGLQMVGKMLLGESFDAAEYRDSDTDYVTYDATTDTYIMSFCADAGDWYSLVEISEITETNDTVTVIAYVSYQNPTEIGPAIPLSYSFIKKVYNGFLYYQIQSVSPAE